MRNMSSEKQQVGIVGSGLIGRSWSMLFAAADYSVVLYDIVPEQGQRALKEIQVKLQDLQKSGLLRGTLTVDQQLANIRATTVFEECIKGSFYIQECVPERIEIKKSVYEKADKLLDDDVILASSSSAFLPSKLAADIRHKNRFIVAHPTNPPFYVPVTELVPSPWTDPDVVPTAKAIMDKIGQVPVVLQKEIIGFVLNRLQYSIIKEAWFLIQAGVINVEDLDKAMTGGLGRRYAFVGPFETAYLNADGMISFADRYGDISWDIMQSFKEPQRMEGPTLTQIQAEMERRVPMDQLEDRRRWRDRRLAALTQLYQKMDAEDKK